MEGLYITPQNASQQAALYLLAQVAREMGLQVREQPVETETSNGQMLLEAFAELRKLKAFADIIDPVAWQREQRQDRQLY